MAKSKKGMKNLILTIVCIVFGALLFSSMFMPMIARDDMDSRFSAVDVITAMGFTDKTENVLQYYEDRANASDSARFASDMLDGDTEASTKAAGILNVVASIFGGLLMVMAILSLFFKSGLLKKLMIVFGILGTLCAIGSLVSAFIMLGSVGNAITINAACFVAVISGLVSAICAWQNK